MFVESLLEKSHAEARRWLSGAERPELRSLAQFRTAATALRFVESFYGAGAETIVVVPVQADKRGRQFADSALIKLPRTPVQRKALQKLCGNLCEKRGGAVMPENELGQSHLFLGLGIRPAYPR